MTSNKGRQPVSDSLHKIEDSAIDAYHTIDEHDARELHHDARGILLRARSALRRAGQQFRRWYLNQPRYLQIAYGFTLVPVIAALSIVSWLIVKFGAPLLFALLVGIKLIISSVKIVFFIGYIGYKILKTVLLWYYTISRLYLGNKAKRKRQEMAQRNAFSIEPNSWRDRYTLRCDRKYLVIERQADQAPVRVLFSYLRYALNGQWLLFEHIKSDWLQYLTIWRAASRERIKQSLVPIGAATFTPHTLGAEQDSERILVPGDAVLTRIVIDQNSGDPNLIFLIRWVDWHFQWQRRPWFLNVRREIQTTRWEIRASFQAS